MADLLSIISANYVAVGQNVVKPGKYVDVDPQMFEGSWNGKYANGQQFSIQISNVQGFRAKVKYQSGSVLKYQEVLIKDNAFRVADSKFQLTKPGTAQIKTVLGNGSSQTLETSFAKKS
ncbi:MAG: hypothetical protein ACOY4O_15715 [Pseudomonadota bacterium]|jgi:hypothetical protein